MGEIWLPFLITYGVITFSLSSLVALAWWRIPKFRQAFEQPLVKFWVAWIIVVVCSGGMIAMMIFPGADGVLGWGMLKYDGAFVGEDWVRANEINTQIIVLCFTLAALVNQPPNLTELYLHLTRPQPVLDELFPRPVTRRQRLIFLLFANANCMFMYPLTFSTWMIPVARRPLFYTAAFLPLSLGSGAAAGIYYGIVTRKANAATPDSHERMEHANKSGRSSHPSVENGGPRTYPSARSLGYTHENVA